MLPFSLHFVHFSLFSALWLFFFLDPAQAVCPHCFGTLNSCSADASGQTCPLITTVAANVGVVISGTGILKLAGLLKPRFLRIFSRVSLETILALVRRSQPGTVFEITATTRGPAILAAVQNGLLTMENAVLKLATLIEDADDEDVQNSLMRRLDILKTSADIQHKTGQGAFSGLFDSGILTYMWAKTSEFVMTRDMQVKLAVDLLSTGDASASTSANGGPKLKFMRPSTMAEFAEMMNLFAMYLAGLGVASFFLLSEFYEHIVFDSIRQRGETWEFAHELLLVVFRRIEDSGGKLNLGNVTEELHLNTLMQEARVNVAAFFRPPGGIPGTVITPSGDKPLKWNNQFTKGSKIACRYFNTGTDHPADKKHLHPDGTCRYNHVCDHWVSNKGKNGRCLDPGHARGKCNNPNLCDTCVN